MTRKVLRPAKKGKVADKVIQMAVRKVSAARPYRNESELAGKIEDVIHEYDGMVSVVAVVGILDMVKVAILAEND